MRASQGQPVCTAQESTWWYPLPAEERQCRGLGILDTAVAAGGVQDVINCHYFNQIGFMKPISKIKMEEVRFK